MASVPPPTFPPSPSPSTAFALVLPKNVLPLLQPFRSLYDAAAIKWPPHMNLFYPFVHPSALASASEYLNQHLPSILPPSSSIKIRFAKCEIFASKKRPSYLVLRPDDESEELLQEIFRNLAREFPDIAAATKKAFKPHLTIGQVGPNKTGRAEQYREKFEMLCDMLGEVDCGFSTMERVDGNMRFVRSWGVEPYGVDLTGDAIPGAVVRRNAWKSAWGEEGEWRNVDDTPWEVDDIAPEEVTKKAGAGFGVLSYNIMTDFEDEGDSTGRYLKIIRNVLVTDATIVCFQEITEDFLRLLGQDMAVKKRFGWISHNPGHPLLRHLSCVVLSELPFAWEEVTSSIRGRSFVVTKFPGLGYYTADTSDEETVDLAEKVEGVSLGNTAAASPSQPSDTDVNNDIKVSESQKTFHPLILTNIHLPAYLIDETIATRYQYVKELKNYLDTAYPTNPSLIVGDTNIPHQETIDWAVSNRVITTESGASYADLFPSDAYLDAWEVAGDGINGNTFCPEENPLATRSVDNGSSIPIRHQRYDRIYLRKQGGEDSLLIREMSVIRDASPAGSSSSGSLTDSDVGSDHYMLSAKLAFVDKEKTPDEAELLQLPDTDWTDKDLRQLLTDNKCIPTNDDISLRQKALRALEDCLKSPNGLPLTPHERNRDRDSSFTLRVTPVGSYGLGTFDPSSDIDVLVTGNISTGLFWKVAKQRIKRWRGVDVATGTTRNDDSPLSVKMVRYVDAAIPMLILLIGGQIRIDLQYCTAVRLVEHDNWSRVPNLPFNDPLFALPVSSLKKLQAYRDMLHILQNVPNLATFRLAYRFLRLWASNKGIYSSKFGLLGGVHITLLLSRVCLLLPHRATACQIITAFFKAYSDWAWESEIVSLPNTGRKIRYQRTGREKMVILTVNTPAVNVALNATVHTVASLRHELETANTKAELGSSLVEVVGAIGDETAITNAVGEFLAGYGRFIKVDVQFWGTGRTKGRALVGWVESRIVLLLTELGLKCPSLTARVWPKRFHEIVEGGNENIESTGEEDARQELRGFYLVGLAPSATAADLSNEEKKAAETAVSLVMQNFEKSVTRPEKYDAGEMWVGVGITKPDNLATEVGNIVQEDLTGVWDGGVADDGESMPDDDETDESEEEVAAELLDENGKLGESGDDSWFFGKKEKKGKKGSKAGVVEKTGPTVKLRPSHEVFNRLKWDSRFDAGQFVVGYEDRFRGVLEVPAEKWKTEMSDEEFVPMHRVVYFKNRITGEVVWDREKRIDKVFGSGRAEEPAGARKKGKGK